jgi:hypothetical protein
MIQRLRASGSPALAVLATISFVSSLGISIMLPLLPLYALSLGASPLQLGLMTSGFAVANGIAQFASGFLMDRYGARRFIVAGIGTYAAANVLIATAPTAIALIGYRFIAGLGGGVNMVATRLYIAQTAEQASLAFFNSIISAANSAGSVLGPGFGGLVAAGGDLRAPFFIVAGTSALAFIAALFLPRPKARAHEGGTAANAGGRVWNRTVFILLAGNPAPVDRLRRLGHELRAVRDDPPRLVYVRRRHHLHDLRHRRHHPRSVARASRRPHRQAPHGRARVVPDLPLRVHRLLRTAEAVLLRHQLFHRRRADRLQRVVVRPSDERRPVGTAGSRVRCRERRRADGHRHRRAWCDRDLAADRCRWGD